MSLCHLFAFYHSFITLYIFTLHISISLFRNFPLFFSLLPVLLTRVIFHSLVLLTLLFTSITLSLSFFASTFPFFCPTSFFAYIYLSISFYISLGLLSICHLSEKVISMSLPILTALHTTDILCALSLSLSLSLAHCAT